MPVVTQIFRRLLRPAFLAWAFLLLAAPGARAMLLDPDCHFDALIDQGAHVKQANSLKGKIFAEVLANIPKPPGPLPPEAPRELGREDSLAIATPSPETVQRLRALATVYLHLKKQGVDVSAYQNVLAQNWPHLDAEQNAELRAALTPPIKSASDMAYAAGYGKSSSRRRQQTPEEAELEIQSLEYARAHYAISPETFATKIFPNRVYLEESNSGATRSYTNALAERVIREQLGRYDVEGHLEKVLEKAGLLEGLKAGRFDTGNSNEVEHALEFYRLYLLARGLGAPKFSMNSSQQIVKQRWGPLHLLSQFARTRYWPGYPKIVVEGLSQAKKSAEGTGKIGDQTNAETLLFDLVAEHGGLNMGEIAAGKKNDLKDRPDILSLVDRAHVILFTDPKTGEVFSLAELLMGYSLRRVADGEGFLRKKLTALLTEKLVAPSKPVVDVETVLTPQDKVNTEAKKLDKEMAEQPGLRELVEAYADRPALLLEVIEDLFPKWANRNVSDFISRYVGLHADKIGERTRSRAREQKPGQDRSAYLKGLMAALESGEAKVDHETLQRPIDHLIRLSRLEFQVSPLETIQKLRDEAKHFEMAPGLSDKARTFLVKLHERAAEHFDRINRLQVKNMRTKPFGYQREGVRFLMDHDLAILADEAGMGKTYQVVAAAETLGLKRVLYVTTASNKNNIKADILEHSLVREDEIAVIDASSPEQRKKQIEKLGPNIRYIIINYEQLASLHEPANKASFDALTKGLDLVVADEGHLADNADTDRARALYAVNPPRKWISSATPYQNKVENLYNILHYLDPKEFPSEEFFKKNYAKDVEGLKRLHNRLQDYLLRRRKNETVREFESPNVTPFAQQLADGSARLPRKQRISPDVEGGFEMLPEQSDILAAMAEDYPAWARRFNANLPPHVEKVPDKVNSLQKFQLMNEVFYDPQRFGITQENPLFRALDKSVADRIARGEKVILWAFNEKMLDALEQRYGPHGVVRIDGKKDLDEKDLARIAFQEKGAKVLVANYRSGGVGLTLTAAHSAIYVQLPMVFGEYYQSEGRHHRVIGENNLRFAKETADVLWMVPRYDTGKLNRTTNPTTAQILRNGTVAEQTVRRLEGGELIYQMVLEGHTKAEDLDRFLKNDIIRSVEAAEKGKAIPEVPLTEVARRLLPLAKKFRTKATDEDSVLRVVDLLADHPEHGVPIAREIELNGEFSREDVDLIASIFDIRNSHVRGQLLAKLPEILRTLREAKSSLAQEAARHKIGRLTATEFIGGLLLKGDNPVGLKIADEMLDLPANAPQTRNLTDRFHTAQVALAGTWGAKWVQDHAASLGALPLERRIEVLYDLSLVVRANATAHGEFSPEQSKALLARALAKQLGVEEKAVVTRFGGQPQALETALALGLGYRDTRSPILEAQWKESMTHVVDGTYPAWRQAKLASLAGTGKKIPTAKAWQELFLKNETSDGAAEAGAGVHAQLENLNRWLDKVGGVSGEGPFVADTLQRYRGQSPPERTAYRELHARRLGLLKQWIDQKQNVPAPLAAELAKEFNGVIPGIKADNLRDLTRLQSLLSQLSSRLDLEDAAADPAARPSAAALTSLSRLERLYRGQNQPDLAEEIARARANATAENSGKGKVTKAIRIEETDDPLLLLRQGQLTEDLINCFNANGNPSFNQYVVTTLGSPNIKMIIARDEEGRPIGVAMMKIKTVDGKPVLFLEKGIASQQNAAVRQAMENFVVGKASRLSATGTATLAMGEVTKKADPARDRMVDGTGAYTENEYVESVFGIRRAANVRHMGRELFLKP